MKEKNSEKWLLKHTKAEATSCFIVGALEDHSTLADFAEYNHVVWFIEEERLPKESTRYQNVYPMTLESIDKTNVDEIVRTLSDENMVFKPDVFCTEHILENYSSSYNFIIQRIQIFLENKHKSVNTLLFHGFLSQTKIIPNIPNFIKNRVCNDSKNTFRGIPAAVVGAGPSLEKSIHLLQKYQKKMLIFCADSAVKTIHKSGINPDAILTVDVTKKPREYLAPKQSVKSLFISMKSPLEWVNEVETNLHFLSGSNLADRFMAANGIIPTECRIIGNCGVTALNLSIFLGCTPIMLFGMDHAADESGRLWSGREDHNEREKQRDASEGWTTVEGNYSKNIKSYVSHELEEFKKVAASAPNEQEIWNINDRGAKVNSAKLIHPDNFTFDRENITKDKNIDLKIKTFDKKGVKKFLNTIGKSLKQNKSTIRKLKNGRKLDDNELCMHLANLFKDKNIHSLCGNFSLKISPLIVKWDELPQSLKDILRLETKEIIELLQSLHSSLLKMNTE